MTFGTKYDVRLRKLTKFKRIRKSEVKFCVTHFVFNSIFYESSRRVRKRDY